MIITPPKGNITVRVDRDAPASALGGPLDGGGVVTLSDFGGGLILTGHHREHASLRVPKAGYARCLMIFLGFGARFPAIGTCTALRSARPSRVCLAAKRPDSWCVLPLPGVHAKKHGVPEWPRSGRLALSQPYFGPGVG